jgi:cell division GTPase FtsZ
MIVHFRANGNDDFAAIQNAAPKLTGLCANEATFIWGYLEDADMKGEARVTVVAAG